MTGNASLNATATLLATAGGFALGGELDLSAREQCAPPAPTHRDARRPAARRSRFRQNPFDLDAAVEDAEAQIAELDRQREAAVTRLAELTHLREGRERSADCGNDPSPIAKARLFADLFRGREDVFAVRWENATKGRSGYSPRCANEGRPGTCGKTKVRCGACQRQAFASLEVQQLLAHLRGQQVIGLYPLLADDSCRLLAIDLDGDSLAGGHEAVSIDGVLSAASARFITGLTATPYRRDGHQPIITMQCGPVRHTARAETSRQADIQDRRVFRRETPRSRAP